MGVGYDSIDAAACAKRGATANHLQSMHLTRAPGIAVSNTPGVANEPTASHAMSLILNCLRRMQIPLSALRAGQWRGRTEPGRTPAGKMLGIVGMGAIGTALAQRAVAFDMQIQYHNRTPLPDERNPTDARYVSLQRLLTTSDVVSIHVPLRDSTRHMIGASEIQSMKKGSVLINTAHGQILDEIAIVEALDTGHLWSVGLDVFEDELDIHEGLLQSGKCILTPHLGTFTESAPKEVELLAIENVRMAVMEDKLETPVAESVELIAR